MMHHRFVSIITLLCLLTELIGQAIPLSAYQNLRYRMIGPFRAGRTVGAVGVPSRPNVFYIGVNNGGIWKTDDYGRTWNPIFDAAPTGSVGDIAVSPSQPDILYAGTGEGLHRPDLSVGDGVYRSADGGSTWKHMGLKDIQQIGRIIVHPSNPDEVFVAGLGHPYGPNTERGVFRSHNGGKSWEKVLYVNENTGAIQVEYDPNNPATLFASLWEHREGPWENGNFSGPNSGLYTSRDGGSTWTRVLSGLPGAAQGLGRVGVCFAPSDSRRMYATVDARENGGIYRSDNGGADWKLISTDRRTWGRGSDFAEIKVHPLNPDVVFIANIAAYKSTDGGKNWFAIKGAPGGDDYHRIWINPLQPDIMLYAADQGAVVTVNGGRTWSSWYNQPTAQLYHVSTDNAFPYMVYGGQQESGAIGVSSRGNGGQISFRDWMGVGADEYAYVAPDPLNPEIIYGGRVLRFNKKTGQTQYVGPEALRSGKYRVLRTMPLLFHPADPRTLLFATNVLWKTTDGGQHWQIISPDLSREQPEVPESIGTFRTPELAQMPRRGVIYSVGPSPLDVATIWAGTDDGLVHLTRDGGASWINATPPMLRAWDKISQIDAGHFDPQTAYISVNAFRRDDLQPYIYKTHDGGKTWKRISKGIGMDPVNVVREDPKQPGLLFAGTEREVYFSVDDGENWQPLRLNMPATSIRDLVIHENDLVIGTHGRSIWILDNIAPLREIAKATAGKKPFLCKPVPTHRVRWNMFSDTPLPPEEPTGQNPPDGAILDYYLSATASQVTLEILDARGTQVRRFSSSDLQEIPDTNNYQYPTYWFRPAQRLGTSGGHHRFVWDLRYAPPRGSDRQYAIAAVYQNTPSGPDGPFVHPGKYMVRLTVDGQMQESTLEVRLDPRVQASESDIQLQTDYSLACYEAYHRLQALRESIDEKLKGQLPADRRQAMQQLRGSGNPGGGDILYGSIYESPSDKETVVGLQEKLLHMLNLFQTADVRPTAKAIEAVQKLQEAVGNIEKRGKLIQTN
jgi:photosystem II stability/assembly factor-like uncharacterized protein